MFQEWIWDEGISLRVSDIRVAAISTASPTISSRTASITARTTWAAGTTELGDVEGSTELVFKFSSLSIGQNSFDFCLPLFPFSTHFCNPGFTIFRASSTESPFTRTAAGASTWAASESARPLRRIEQSGNLALLVVAQAQSFLQIWVLQRADSLALPVDLLETLHLNFVQHLTKLGLVFCLQFGIALFSFFLQGSESLTALFWRQITEVLPPFRSSLKLAASGFAQFIEQLCGLGLLIVGESKLLLNSFISEQRVRRTASESSPETAAESPSPPSGAATSTGSLGKGGRGRQHHQCQKTGCPKLFQHRFLP
jgi:hypothetical protein